CSPSRSRSSSCSQSSITWSAGASLSSQTGLSAESQPSELAAEALAERTWRCRTANLCRRSYEHVRHSSSGEPHMIEFSHVNKRYGEYHALVDINAQVNKGEVVVVCGPSGSGKSTLIRTVNRLEEIQSGTLTFDGQNVHAKMSSKELNRIRSRIGFVFQSFN